MRKGFFPLVLLFFHFAGFPLQAADRIAPELDRLITSRTTGNVAVWIFFAEKTTSALADIPVSRRSLDRRAKVRPVDRLLDSADYPVNPEYIDAVRPIVRRIRQISRWFNAVSADVPPDRVSELLGLPFVTYVDLVARSRRSPDPQFDHIVPNGSRKTSGTSTLDYGDSFDQLDQIRVPQLHDQGITGSGVLVGVFDNGFRLLNHEAFDSLRIIATYDFVDKKESVVPNDPRSSFGSHGINTLSAIGGYKPGHLIGAAFGAEFILARTENDSSETPVEEDNWIAAIEWADSIGVDVTTTSLVYRGYDQPYTGWTWEDMDGNTTMITRAADMAAARGIVVVNAAGNFGNSPVPGQNTLGAPADGDSVLSVGAVDGSGNRAAFSSVGPTAGSAPRIKPDVMARGVLVQAASGINPTGYIATGGTSLACPLAAGVAALLLSRFPDATPMEIIQAMRLTGNNRSSPNNEMGWGIVDAAAALGYLANPGEIPSTAVLVQNYPNPFNGTTRIDFFLPGNSSLRLEIFDLLGRRTALLVDGERGPGWHYETWNGENSSGIGVSSGVYIIRLLTDTGVSERAALLIK